MSDSVKVLKKTKNINGIYTCDELDITIEEWKNVLQSLGDDKNNYKLWLARFYLEQNHKSSCKNMAVKYDCSVQSPNSTIMNFGKYTQIFLNRFEV